MKEIAAAIALAILVGVTIATLSWFLHGGVGEPCNRDGTCNNGNLQCVVVPERGHRCVIGGKP